MNISKTFDAGYRIHITFRYFKLEYSKDCVNDFVSVHDGPRVSSPVIKKFCGEKKTHMVMESTTNVMTVRFKTNEQITNYGFLALFIRVAIPTPRKKPKRTG